MNAVPVFLHDTKVFDPEWPYLMTILSCIGMTKPFIKLIRLLYNNPINKLYINSQISLSIPIGCGTHQGCSLSTILFAPALDPLAAKFRQKYLQYSSRFMNDPYWPHSMWIADGITLYLRNTQDSLNPIMQEIIRFGNLWDLTMNWGKSAIFLLTQKTLEVDLDFSLKWQDELIKT